MCTILCLEAEDLACIVEMSDTTSNDTSTSKRIVEYVPKDTSTADCAEDLRRRRGGSLLNLDRILLHSPEFASGWNHLFSALRGPSVRINAKFRELAICSIAVLNCAEYEFYQHEQPWRDAGASEAQIDAINDINTDRFKHDRFDAIELQVLASMIS